MLFILLNWTYIFITSYIGGYGILYGLQKRIGYRPKSFLAVLLTGILAMTAYAQWFSCFYRVNFEANLVLALLLIGVVFWCKGHIWEFFREQFRGCSRAKKVGLILLILVVAYFTSRGNYLWDTNLYHAQSVRWLEEYGAVKGLANLQSRAAYNSSMFCLTALYSMKYLFGQSMHAVQGFMALILAVQCMDIGKLWHRKRMLLSDFARVGAIYYLTILHKEIMSPASDFAVMLTLFILIIKWLDLIERGESEIAPYALLCVLGVHALTLKLTAGLILILVIKPFVMLCKEKRWKEMGIYVLLGLMVVTPYLVRNVIICGWIIYPFSGLDLFNVDWKVPAVKVDADAFQIKSWGKGIHDYSLYHAPVSEWIPGWYHGVLTGTERLLFIADLIALIGILIWGGVLCLSRTFSREKKEWDELLVSLTVAVSYLFWLLSAPLTRYGYAYILLLVMLVFGKLFLVITPKAPRVCLTGFLLAVGVLGLWKGMVLFQGFWETRALPAYVRQTDYDSNEGDDYVKEHKINGTTFFYRVTGYHPLPGGDIQFTMRGDTIKDGFRFAEYNEKNVFGEYLQESE